ncbi:TPA: hypothetical protein ND482_004557 [Citrobacter farmeri]|nr:hypothetical protein [Citrobacter farmeri]
MSGLITVLPHRNETGITLSRGGIIEISQTEIDGNSSSIQIHVSDAPRLIEAINAAIETFEAEANADGVITRP